MCVDDELTSTEPQRHNDTKPQSRWKARAWRPLYRSFGRAHQIPSADRPPPRRVRVLRPALLLALLLFLLPSCGPSKAERDATATVERQESQTATATAARATAASIDSFARLVFGPEDVALEHNPNDKQVVTYEIEDEVRDFVVEARFTTPYDGSEYPWDIGFLLRSNEEDDQLRLVLSSDASWALIRAKDGDPPIFQTIQQGSIDPFDMRGGVPITIRVTLDGEHGLLFVDDAYIAPLDLSAKTSAGTVMVGTGFYTGDEQEGAVTRVRDFRVWKIER